MSTSRRGNQSGKVTGALLAGLLLVPASAIAAVAIIGATSAEPAEAAFDEDVTTTTIEFGTTTTSIEVEDETDPLDEACAEGAEELIEKETEGSISDLEAAALDALRQLCDEAGMPLVGPPVPEPIVQVITVVDDSDGPDDEDNEHDDYDDEDHEDDDDYDDEDEHGDEDEDHDDDEEHDEEDDDEDDD